MVVCLLVVVSLLAFPGLLLWVQVRERQAWERYRLRLAPEAISPDFARQLRGLLGQGGELWWLRDGATQALIVALPPARVAELRDLCTRYAPGHALSPVRLQLAADFLVRWHLLLPTATPALRVEQVAPVALLILAGAGRGALLVAGEAAPALAGWRPSRLPQLLLPTAALRRHGFHVLRLVGTWRAAALPPAAVLLPPLDEVPGLVLPALPPTLPTTLRTVAGPALALGRAVDDHVVSIPLTGMLEVTGDEAGRRSALVHVSVAATAPGAGLLVYASAATVDLLLARPELQGRTRVLDPRRLATTATFDLDALLPDAQLLALFADVLHLPALDEHGHLRRLLTTALGHWRTLKPPRQLGQLLTALVQPTPALMRASGLDDFAVRFAAERWKRVLRPLLERQLASLLVAPGEDVSGIWAAGGALLVVQPAHAAPWALLRAILRAVVEAQAPPTRPVVVVEERPAEEIPLDVRDWPGASMTVWGQSAWSTDAAWRLATGGGTAPRYMPAHLRRHIHPLALLRPQRDWLVCEPDTDEVALLLPPGSSRDPFHTSGSSGDARLVLPLPAEWAAVQTVLGTLRQVGQLLGGLGAVDLLVARPPRREVLTMVEATLRQVFPVEVRLGPGADGAEVARHLGDLGATALQVRAVVQAGPQTFLQIDVVDPGAPAVVVPSFTLAGLDRAAGTLLWERLQALLVHGAATVALAQHILLETLRTVPADQLGLALLGELPPSLQPFVHAPHVAEQQPAPGTPLVDALLALLADQLGPDGDARPLLVVVALPENMPAALMQALARVLRRAQSRRAFALLVAPVLATPTPALDVLRAALPTLSGAGASAHLAWQGHPWWSCAVPPLVADAGVQTTLQTLPSRGPRPAPLPLPDLAAFWDVSPHALAPALPIATSVGPAAQGADGAAEHAEDGPDRDAAPWVLEGILTERDLHSLITALLLSPTQRIGPTWVVARLAEQRPLSRAAAEEVLTLLTAETEICVPAPGGGVQLKPGLTEDVVWTTLEETLSIDRPRPSAAPDAAGDASAAAFASVRRSPEVIP
jgi:hypothetical protein